MLSLILATLAVTSAAAAQSLHVYNKCVFPVQLFTQTSYGSIGNNFNVASGATQAMGISPNWAGAINVGTGCNGNNCATGGPSWDGRTPFSRAEFNYWAIPGSVTYDISMIYGFNVGMQISTGNGACPAFSCGNLFNGCPVPGPAVAGGQWASCFSGCCSSSGACANGALPGGGGGCVNNAGPGPHTSFFDAGCPNAYAFPDNDGAAGYTPRNYVDYTCGNTAVTLTLCPGSSSHY